MADYYSLLARKVASLEQSTPQTRKAIYDVARRALLNQLRSIKPPIAEEVIAAEEQALDQAVARVEAETEVQTLPDAPLEKPAPETPAPPTPKASAEPAPREQKPEPLVAVRQRPAARIAKTNPAARQKRWFLAMAVGSLLLVGLLAFVALRYRERPEDLAKFNPNESSAASEERGKIGDRVSDADRRRAGADPGPPVPVAQRAEFYVAYPNQPEKVEHIYSGTVLWRLENAGAPTAVSYGPPSAATSTFPTPRSKRPSSSKGMWTRPFQPPTPSASPSNSWAAT